MKIFFVSLASLVLVLTVINKVSIRYGYRQKRQFPTSILFITLLILLGISIYLGYQAYHVGGHQYFNNLIITLSVFAIMLDVFRRRF